MGNNGRKRKKVICFLTLVYQNVKRKVKTSQTMTHQKT